MSIQSNHLRLVIIVCLFFSLPYSVFGRVSPDGLSGDQLRRAIADESRQNHHSLGYTLARKELLGRISLEQRSQGFVIRDVYCEDDYDSSRFSGRRGPAPGVIPDDRVLNTEHTWPQSRFSGGPRETQKSDLHHLFPSDTELNGVRGNFPFGEVTHNERSLRCPASRAGFNDQGQFVFEPPPAHRGNVARALFYFAVRYGLTIDTTQERVLRQWHVDDPVDTAERTRNDEIEKVQGNRNPFIDQPELVSLIGDF